MADETYWDMRKGQARTVRSSSSGYNVVGIVIGALAFVIAVIAMVLALWKWGYWDTISSAAAVHTTQNVVVDGWINSLTAYMISGYTAIRLAIIPLLPSPDVAIIYGNLGITTELQEAETYFLWSTAQTTTQPNNWFIDSYIQQLDAAFGTIGLNFFTMNGYWFMSDSDHKVNISDINGTEALQIVRAIDPSTFFWADDAQQTLQFGFIAQNVNDTFPEAVSSFSGGGANQTLGVSTIALLSQLWAAVKELDKQINP